MRKITELLETMDVEDLVKSYFRLGFSNKEILCLLAHQHAVIISKGHCSGYVGNLIYSEEK